MNKILYFILLLIFGFFLIYIFGQEKKKWSSQQEEAAAIFKEPDDIMDLVELENRKAWDHMHEHIRNNSGELPDYKELFPDLYTVYDVPESMEEGRKIAYLTFDDGPSSNTFKILDILEEQNIRATFFIVGSSISVEGEDCLRRMVNEGHTIGIHTYSHLCNEIYCSVERFLNDYNTVYQQIYDITGKRANIYRFPWGSNNCYGKAIKDTLLEEMERRGFACYDWNVDANDSFGRPTQYSIRRNIEKDLEHHDYPIILMHDSSINNTTVRTLPDIIKMIRDKGYEFDTLDNRKPYQFNW